MTSGSTAIEGFLAIVAAAATILRVLWRGGCVRLEPDPKDADRTGDVLDALVAEILERDVLQPVADLIAHRARDADAARLGEHFEARRDVDAVAKDVVFLDDHVAQIDADAELYPPRRRDVHVASRHPALDLGSAKHRVGDAVELDQHAVAGGLDDAAVALGDGRIDELDPMGLETRERPGLVDLHQPTVTDHISRDDRREPALWSGHTDLSGYFGEQYNRSGTLAQACGRREQATASGHEGIIECDSTAIRPERFDDARWLTMTAGNVARAADVDQPPVTSTTASAKACGASWGRLCPMPPSTVRCEYLPGNFPA